MKPKPNGLIGYVTGALKNKLHRSYSVEDCVQQIFLEIWMSRHRALLECFIDKNIIPAPGSAEMKVLNAFIFRVRMEFMERENKHGSGHRKVPGYKAKERIA